MISKRGLGEINPEKSPQSLAALNQLIADSPAMVKGGSRAVLGEGPLHPDIAFVGEQPGDRENATGRPFVGLAGKLLDKAMAEAGIDRKRTYITNVVKHFKYESRAKRRIHSKPSSGEIKRNCWWLKKELELFEPRLVVAFGATAALALTGKPMAVAKNRGPTGLSYRSSFISIAHAGGKKSGSLPRVRRGHEADPQTGTTEHSRLNCGEQGCRH